MLTAGGTLASLDPAVQEAPNIDYLMLAPMLVVFGAAVLGVVVEAFVPRAHRRPTQLVLAFVGLVVAFVCLLVQVRELPADSPGVTIAFATVAIDRPTLFLHGTVLLLALASLLLFAANRREAFAPQAATIPGSEEEREHEEAESEHTEVYPLVLFAVLGMLLFPASNDFLTMFVALEVLSFPLYLLCGLARTRRLFSQEAALKYFLLGAYSSAFFLFGIALVFGYAGSVHFVDIDEAAAAGGAGVVEQGEPLLMLGIALVAVGLLFKVGAVPFHNWKPDVYQGAPTPVTALMASGTVVAAFGGLLRVFFLAFDGLTWDWRPMLWIVAILTMVVAAAIAVTQRDVKRLLAYSSVVHAGFILTAVVAASPEGLAGALFYLAAYGFTTVGAFAVVTLVRVREGGAEAGELSQWAGLGRSHPLLAGALALFLLAFAGIPLTSGFIGKFAVFEAALAAGAAPLVVVGVLASAITAFFYVRIIVLMYFSEPQEEGPWVVTPGPLTGSVIGVGVAATLVLGIMPGPVFDHLLPQPAQEGVPEEASPMDMYVR
ncbi:NADH-quinone oxidoreductase subunit NuoN [Lipingzhangella sp. LS1_29]|uniref:NADH-quinone oxidoreductase subunit N n=1 Tax=Lipingzhangella rawalii TaxID=2055835 RepID=A0ABU2H8X8_9ACTN|nr:NADH-quinone oxidoreductase subunit NuoN [Lipingzhangella rawalii]MDS1271754.1 NADH-quinone oxidoreductase subunit NuoN [Lipingzhangella rawalii]